MTPEELFAAWWAEYPRKVAIGYARKCFVKAVAQGLITEAMLPDMLKTLAWQRKEWGKRDDPSFIPHPSTYINQERWMDEPLSKSVAPKCPTFYGTTDFINMCERIWRKNPTWAKGKCEDEAQRMMHDRRGEPSNVTSLSDIVAAFKEAK